MAQRQGGLLESGALQQGKGEPKAELSLVQSQGAQAAASHASAAAVPGNNPKAIQTAHQPGHAAGAHLLVRLLGDGGGLVVADLVVQGGHLGGVGRGEVEELFLEPTAANFSLLRQRQVCMQQRQRSIKHQHSFAASKAFCPASS